MSVLGRVLLSAGALLGLAYWSLFAVYMFVLECDENCSPGQAGDPGYDVQFVIAMVGVLSGLAAIALGFTRRRQAYLTCIAVSVLSLLGWFASSGDL